MSNWGGKREGAGRPPGSSPLTKAREALQAHAPEIIEKLMEKVREGDSVALKLAVERLIPVAKEEINEKRDLPAMQIQAFRVVSDEREYLP